MAETAREAEQIGRERYKPYPAYKDSGVAWLGEIPAHWEIRRLKYVAPCSNERSKDSLSALPYVGLEHIEGGTGKLVHNDIESGTDEIEEADVVASIFRPGDVLFGKLRPYLA